jgi:hypothetical protein
MSISLGEPESNIKDDEGQIYSLKIKNMDEYNFHAYEIRFDKEL